MAENGIQVLMTTSPENINYLTGYAGWSFYTQQALILHIDASEPILVLRSLDVACAEFTSYLRAENVIGYSEQYVDTPGLHAMSFVADVLKECGWADATIGVETDACFLTPLAFAALRDALPLTRIVDAGPLVNWVRAIKSSAEIELLRQSGAIASNAMDVAISEIDVGVRECDLAARVYATQIAGTSEFGGGVPIGMVVSAGDKTRAPHLSWSDDVFSNDQAVNLELGGSRHQYHCGIARSVYLGRPPRSLIRLSTAVVDGLGDAMDKLRPGVLCEDVAKVWNECIARAGYRKESRIGYSIGLGFQPMWVEGTASLRIGDKTKVRPNMVFHVICGMWRGRDNFVLSETVRVTETGLELLTNVDRRLFVKT